MCDREMRERSYAWRGARKKHRRISIHTHCCIKIAASGHDSKSGVARMQRSAVASAPPVVRTLRLRSEDLRRLTVTRPL